MPIPAGARISKTKLEGLGRPLIEAFGPRKQCRRVLATFAPLEFPFSKKDLGIPGDTHLASLFLLTLYVLGKLFALGDLRLKLGCYLGMLRVEIAPLGFRFERN